MTELSKMLSWELLQKEPDRDGSDQLMGREGGATSRFQGQSFSMQQWPDLLTVLLEIRGRRHKGKNTHTTTLTFFFFLICYSIWRK